MHKRNILLLPLALCFFCITYVSCVSIPKSTQETSELKQEFLNAFSRSYFPGRSGQILFVPKKNSFFLQSWKKYNHNSPWDYDTHVPLFFYGPAYIKQGVYSEPVRLTDIVPTQCELLKTPPPHTASGKPIRHILKDNPKRPKVILTMIIDQGSYWLIERYLEELRNMLVLKSKGAWFTNYRIDYMPSATAVSHAVIGTGAYPSVNGIVANKMYSSETGNMEVTWLHKKTISPENLACLTLADYWDLQMDNKAIIIGQCSLPRAVGGMIGHGAYLSNADKDIFVAYDKKTGNLTTNPDYYSLPKHLIELNPKRYWEKVGGIFLGHKINSYKDVRFSPVFPEFMGDVFLKILEKEPIGSDDITDLVYINQKAVDYTGHKYGRESREVKETLIAIDRFIGKVIPFLEKKVGEENFVFILTADHGMAPSPEGTGGKRIYEEVFIRELQEEFDLNGDGRKIFLGCSGYNLYIDKDELTKNGFTLKDVKKYLMKHNSIFEAFTESEVIANILNLRKREK